MWGLFGGLAFVAVWSVINVFISMLYNLISDIIGGVESPGPNGHTTEGRRAFV